MQKENHLRARFDWRNKRLKDISKFIDYRGKTPHKTSSGIPLITAKNVRRGYISQEPQEFIAAEDYNSWMTRGFPKIFDLIFTTEAPLGNVAQLDTQEKIALAQRVIVIQPERNICDPKFLMYQILSSDFQKVLSDKSTGTTVKGIKASILKEIEVKITSISEQNRIVSKLDTLFAHLENAIKLVEENIAHTRHLLPAALNEILNQFNLLFHHYPIEKVFKIKSGDFLSSENQKPDGVYDVYGGNGITGKYDKYNLEGDNIIIGRVGAKCGNVRFVNGKIWVTDNAFFISQYLIPTKREYLSIILSAIHLGKTANQAAQPVISYKGIKAIDIPLPDIQTQQKIVDHLNQLSAKQQALLQQYEARLRHLKALKASILSAAFKGQL